MKDRDSRKNQGNKDKQPYEPPKAACVRIQLEERVLGCNFSTIKYCGLTE
jgi:hypothetical protein